MQVGARVLTAAMLLWTGAGAAAQNGSPVATVEALGTSPTAQGGANRAVVVLDPSTLETRSSMTVGVYPDRLAFTRSK